MNFSRVNMVYAANGFYHSGGRITPGSIFEEAVLTAYAETERDFTLAEKELYKTVDMITRIIHTDENASLAQDFEYKFTDARASFVSEQMEKHLKSRLSEGRFDREDKDFKPMEMTMSEAQELYYTYDSKLKGYNIAVQLIGNHNAMVDGMRTGIIEDLIVDTDVPF